MVKEDIEIRQTVISLNQEDIETAILVWLYERHNIYISHNAADIKLYEDGTAVLVQETKRDYTK